MIAGDFSYALAGPVICPHTFYLSFDVVRHALATGKRPSTCDPRDKAAPSLLPHINVDANLYVALICKADGMRPNCVCGRSTVRTILKHAR